MIRSFLNYLIQKDFAVLLKGLFDNKHILQAEGQIFHLVGQRPLVGFNPWDYIEAVKLSIPVKTEQTNLPAGDSPKRMQCQSGNLAQERLELPFAAAANDKIKRKRFGSSFNGPTWIQELVMVIPIQEKQEHPAKRFRRSRICGGIYPMRRLCRSADPLLGE